MSLLSQLKRQYGVGGIAVAIIVALMIFWFASSTQPVVNKNPKTGVLVYPGLPDDVKLPPRFVNYGQAFMAIGLLAVVLYLGMLRGLQDIDFIDIREALKSCEDYYRDMKAKEHPDYKNAKISFNVFNKLVRSFPSQAEPVCKRWSIYSKFTYPESDNKMEQYAITWVHPKNAKVMATMWTDKEPEDLEACSKCGREFDEKIIDSMAFADQKIAIGEVFAARRGDK